MIRVSCVVALFACAMLITFSAKAAKVREPIPAFRGQTEAPPPPQPSRFKVETVAERLASPWALAFLPNGDFLITESRGTMRTISPDGSVSAAIEGVPAVKVVAAQGLHDVVLDPDFENNRLIYFTYFAPPEGEEQRSIWPIDHFYTEVWTKPLAERRLMDLGTETIGKARLSSNARRLEDVEVLFEGRAERRIVFAPDETIYVTGADAFRFYETDLDGVEHDFTDNPDIRRNFSGRVIRITRDGKLPADNPWLNRATVAGETFAHGFKDSEGGAIHPETGELWVIDHGPQGGDEVNIVRPGRDYGWPNVSYGVQYDARQTGGRTNVPVGNGQTSMPGVEEPVYFWVPSIAPSGMAFYTGELFPEWQGNLLIGAMAGQHLVRLVLDGPDVIAEERLLADLELRIREVKVGPDGAVYVFAGDSLLRLVPE